MKTIIRDIVQHLENLAPAVYQEDYDNAGLIAGDPKAEVRGVLVCLDATEEVIREADERGCNLVVAHHPIVFKGLKRFNGASYVERALMLAIRQDIAIYAIHTNLDNTYAQGVNETISKRLGLVNTRILAPKTHWQSLRIEIEPASLELLQEQLSRHGFPPAAHIVPVASGNLIAELRSDPARMPHLQSLIRQTAPEALHQALLQATLQPYPDVGAGLIGQLPDPMPVMEFLAFLKQRMQAGVVRYTKPVGEHIRTVALCGGAGSFLLRKAIAQGADAYISADFKYHEFFDAEDRILIADIGHFESEQFTIELLQQIISQKFSNFAAYCTKTTTNPVRYL